VVVPSRAKAKAEARPMPLEAPVTMTTFPSSLWLRAMGSPLTRIDTYLTVE
jgi:hypothetical protein